MKRLLLIIWVCSLALGPKPAYALFVAGPNQAGSISVSPLAGASQSWRDISNAETSDDHWAISADSLIKNEYTDDLVFQDFGFSLPSYAVILGIQIILECHRSSGNIQNYRSRLIYNGSILGTDIVSPGLWPTPNDKSLSHGGLYETWGASWNGSQINATTFGYVMGIDMTSNDGKNHAAYVDQVSILVYYDIPLAFEEPIRLISLWKEEQALLKSDLPDFPEGVSVTIERSDDGQQFQPIGKEYLNPEALTDSFLWIDPHFPSDLETGRYYRMLVQPNGSEKRLSSNVSYLPPLPKEQTSYTIRPLFIAEELWLQSHGSVSGSVSSRIYGINGQLMWKNDFIPGQAPYQTRISISSWAPGRYYLIVLTEQEANYLPLSLP